MTDLSSIKNELYFEQSLTKPITIEKVEIHTDQYYSDKFIAALTEPVVFNKYLSIDNLFKKIDQIENNFKLNGFDNVEFTLDSNKLMINAKDALYSNHKYNLISYTDKHGANFGIQYLNNNFSDSHELVKAKALVNDNLTLKYASFDSEFPLSSHCQMKINAINFEQDKEINRNLTFGINFHNLFKNNYFSNFTGLAITQNILEKGADLSCKLSLICKFQYSRFALLKKLFPRNGVSLNWFNEVSPSILNSKSKRSFFKSIFNINSYLSICFLTFNNDLKIGKKIDFPVDGQQSFKSDNFSYNSITSDNFLTLNQSTFESDSFINNTFRILTRLPYHKDTSSSMLRFQFWLNSNNTSFNKNFNNNAGASLIYKSNAAIFELGYVHPINGNDDSNPSFHEGFNFDVTMFAN